MAQGGCGVILITHDINAALSIADRVVIFKDGQALDCVSPSLFYDEDKKLLHPYARKIYQALPQNQFIDVLRSTDHFYTTKSVAKSDKQRAISTLSCKGISYAFSKNKPILKDFDFTMRSNEIVGLTGASGRGKTTLSKIIAGYHKPHSGAISIDDKVIENKTYNPVQLIHQHPEKSVNPRWKLEKTLTEAFPKNKIS